MRKPWGQVQVHEEFGQDEAKNSEIALLQCWPKTGLNTLISTKRMPMEIQIAPKRNSKFWPEYFDYLWPPNDETGVLGVSWT